MGAISDEDRRGKGVYVGGGGWDQRDVPRRASDTVGPIETKKPTGSCRLTQVLKGKTSSSKGTTFRWNAVWKGPMDPREGWMDDARRGIPFPPSPSRTRLTDHTNGIEERSTAHGFHHAFQPVRQTTNHAMKRRSRTSIQRKSSLLQNKCKVQPSSRIWSAKQRFISIRSFHHVNETGARMRDTAVQN